MKFGQLLLFIVALLIGISGCSVASSPQESALPTPSQPPPAAQPSAAQAVASTADLEGVWNGTTAAACLSWIPNYTRCDAVNNVTFTILRKGSAISGYYKCSTGNEDCRDANETGRVTDVMSHDNYVWFRVMLPDGSSCMYDARRTGNTMAGGYTCFVSARLVEQGHWQVKRSY
jgi:hypothetical protein